MPAQAQQSGVQTNEQLKIALLGYRSNPFSGGQGVYLKYLSRALVELGHQVDVISGEPYPELDKRVHLRPLPGLNLYGVPNHLTALRPKHLKSATDLFEWASRASGGFPEPYTFGRRLTKQVDLTQYDVIHDNQSLSYGLLTLQQRGLPLTCTIHHPITWDRDIQLTNAQTKIEAIGIRRWHQFLRMQRKVAKQLRHIVTVSESAKRDICDAFAIPAHRVTVVPNGIDSQEFAPQPHIEREPYRLITTASADQPLKGTHHLIEALRCLRDQFPTIRLTFIGRPKPGGRTEQQLTEANLWSSVDLHTDISNQKLVELYAQAALAVVPSEYEGFGLPAGEAMACGVPVVSTDGGALPEVVGNAGLIVPSRDPQALAKAIATLLNDRGLRKQLGQAGRRRIVERFDWRMTAERMIEHYRLLTE